VRGPELLSLLRYGRAPTAARKRPELPPRTRRLVGICLGFGAIPLVPQGIVPLVFTLSGVAVKSWFLAMYVPDPWSWLVIAGMIALGLTMYGYAGYRLLFPAPPPSALG
jgi:ABC-2 type transport system permease protein